MNKVVCVKKISKEQEKWMNKKIKRNHFIHFYYHLSGNYLFNKKQDFPYIFFCPCNLALTNGEVSIEVQFVFVMLFVSL